MGRRSDVPIASPAARRSSTSCSRPQAITVPAPLRAARLAASTLVIMPPRPIDDAGAAGHALERGVAGVGLVR